MKKLRTFSIVFLIVGGMLLLGALGWWNHTRKFVATAQAAQGRVVELIEVRNKEKDSLTYKPVVTYKTAGGHKVTFQSSFSSNPAPYAVGDVVQVLYATGDPYDARIDGYGSLWAGPTIIAVLGTVFSAVGGGMLLVNQSGRRKKKYLMAYGTAIDTDFQGVERNTAFEFNKKNPWRIATQWLDPNTNK